MKVSSLMKWIIPFLLSIACSWGQSSMPYVQWKYQLSDLLSINPMPSAADSSAVIGWRYFQTNRDGCILWFDRESTATPDNVSVYMPTNKKGRWFRLPGDADGPGGGASVGLSMPGGFNVLNSPVSGTGEITVEFGFEGIIKAFDNEWDNAVPRVDYVAPEPITTSGLTIGAGQKLIGRSTYGTDVIEHIGLGDGVIMESGTVSSGVYVDVQTYSTPGSHTWTKPAGALMTYVVAIGGGAGGWGGDTVPSLDPGYTPNTNGPFINLTYGDLPNYDRGGTYPVNPAAMPWSGVMEIDGFNTNLGVLQEVQMVFQTAMFGSFRHENTDLANGAVIRSDMVTGSGIYLDTGSNIMTGVFHRSFTNTLPTYDGVTDFGGSSGVNVFFGLIGYTQSTNDYVLPSNMVQRFSSGTNVSLTTSATNLTTYSYSGTTSYVTQDSYQSRSALIVTYVYKPYVSVGNTVWYDVNTNGVVDVGEQGVVGATVTLTHSDDTPVEGFPPTLTDANGYYVFTGVHPGDYKVTVTAGPYDVPVWDPYTGSVAPDGISPVTVGIDTNQFDMNFGFVSTAPPAPKFIIGDLVWYDTDGSSTPNNNEPGIPNVEMWLETGGYIDFGPFPPVYVHGIRLATTYTDNAGLYYFKNVPPGDYEVWVNTPPNPLFYGDSTQIFAVPNVKFVTITTQPNYDQDFGYYTTIDYASGRGGGGGGFSEFVYPSTLLPSTVAITVGAGGAGGVGVTDNATDHSGTVGGDSTFGSYLVAYGGGFDPWCQAGCTNGSGYGTVNGGQNGEPTWLYSGFLPRGGRTNGKGAGGGGSGGRVYEYGGTSFSPEWNGLTSRSGGPPDGNGYPGVDTTSFLGTGQGGSGGGGVGTTRAGNGGNGAIPGGGGGGGGLGLNGVNGGLSGSGGNGGGGAVTVITFGIRTNP